ncbi:MAG: DegT/DnrJ/EryC1/StrS family aminotransferase [Verrucomicrobia bacterium]|nr:DegT/DnrJ/EryC1/StrS family aminotransferase [Verrucomicrobiota bacterium]
MIPFLDLKLQYKQIKDEVEDAVLRVLSSTDYVLGPDVAAFEEEFSNYSHTNCGVGVNSGTSALQLALLSMGVQAGDEVITVPFTFIATVAAIEYIGAKPVLIDVEENSGCMDVSKLEAVITERTKVILPVHLHGQMADMYPITAVARKYGLKVLEDAAQAHGASYNGRPAGSFGDAACFSFYPGKNLGAAGEGGLLVTNDLDLAERARVLRDWGQKQKYYHDLLGFNYRMDSIQAAILRVKLKYLNEWTDLRIKVAERYNKLFAESAVSTPDALPNNRHVYHVYALRSNRRDELLGYLKKLNIGCAIHYPIPVHLQKCLTHLNYKRGDFPVSEKLASQVLSLPVYPELTAQQQDLVVSAVLGFFK